MWAAPYFALRARGLALSPLVAGACLVALVLLGHHAAHAQPAPDTDEERASAEALFEEGRLLKDKGDCSRAVEKFLASQRLGPAVGTQLNIADCYTQLGRTASAWVHFREAASLARAQGDARRAQFATSRADALEPTLCRVRVVVEAPVPAQTLTRNGKRVDRGMWGAAIPVDPGEHRVRATAPAYQPWETTMRVTAPGSVSVVTVPPLVALPPEAAPPSGRPDGALHPQTVGGFAVLGLGAAGVVVGIALGVHARVLDDASDAYCPSDPNVCLPEGAELRDAARTFEQSAVVAVAASAAAIGVGLTVALTAPKSQGPSTSLSVLPRVGRDGGNVTLGVSW